MSKGWAKNFWADYAKSSRHGVLIKTRLPKEGMIMTFGQKFEGLTASGIALEYEALIAGGIQPASITGIEIYDKGSISNNPSLTAKRIEKDGQVNIVIEDRHGEFVVSRTYTYSPDGAKFVLTGEEATDILSTTPIDQPPAFYPYAKQDFKQLIGTFKEKYISPFKNQNYSQLLTDSFFIKNTPEKQYNTIIPVKLPKNSEHNLTSIIKPSYIINPLGFGNKGYIPSLPPEKFKMTDFNYKMPEKSNSKIYW